MAYTYLLGWTKQDKWYYGVRFAKDCDPSELWKTYFSSSNYVKAHVEEHGSPDVIEIRRSFSNCDAAIVWESKVLRKLQVIHSERWLNKTDNKSITYDVHPRLGSSLTPETKQKISNANKGKRRTEQVKRQMSISRSGEHHWNYGKHHNNDTKEKIRKGVLHTLETRPEIREKLKTKSGKKMSETAKMQISEKLKGRIFSDDHRRKISLANSKRVLSQETKDKIRTSLLARKKNIP